LTSKLEVYEKSRVNEEKKEDQNETEARLKNEIASFKQKLEDLEAKNCLLEEENKRTKDLNQVI